jgi:hypothetical protein
MHMDASFVSLIRSAGLGRPCLIKYVSYAEIIQVSHIASFNFVFATDGDVLFGKGYVHATWKQKFFSIRLTLDLSAFFVPSPSVLHIVFPLKIPSHALASLSRTRFAVS